MSSTTSCFIYVVAPPKSCRPQRIDLTGVTVLTYSSIRLELGRYDRPSLPP
jgi:hypothetical protein